MIGISTPSPWYAQYLSFFNQFPSVDLMWLLILFHCQSMNQTKQLRNARWRDKNLDCFGIAHRFLICTTQLAIILIMMMIKKMIMVIMKTLNLPKSLTIQSWRASSGNILTGTTQKRKVLLCQLHSVILLYQMSSVHTQPHHKHQPATGVFIDIPDRRSPNWVYFRVLQMLCVPAGSMSWKQQT